MSKLGILGATALSLSLAVATPALAQRRGGGPVGVHVAGMAGGMHMDGGMPHIGGGGFRGAQASIGAGSPPVAGASFAGRSGAQFAQGGYRGGLRGDHDHDGFRRRGFGPGFGFAAGLAAGSALGYGYGGYYDPYYYGDDYAYDDYYDGGYPAAGVWSRVGSIPLTARNATGPTIPRPGPISAMMACVTPAASKASA